MKEEHQKIFDTCNKLCQEIEVAMKIPIDHANGNELKEGLEHLRPYLSNMPLLVAQSQGLWDTMKGEVVNDIIIEEKLLNLKSDLQRKWIEGKLAKFSSLVLRVESLEKNLRSSMEALISNLSYEKELMKKIN